ncbi:peptidase inhibitor family I36 protein [Devosia sp.]|uniref:peptidase inhibitor family I36 protein n=1 Tax=Devosia sp. TaxID=1871048 RepID=UPI003A8DEDE2
MKSIKLAGVAAVLCAMLVPAAAQAATATANVNVRTSPVNGAVVDVLRAGQQVDIDRCQSGWCYVVKPGPDGWVSQNYLSNDRGMREDRRERRRDREDRRQRDDRNDNAPDVSIGFSVPGFNFQIGSGGFDVRPDRPERPNRPARRDRVCFFEDVNFGGDRFCVRPGERLSRLGQWNDKISSVRVSGDAEAQVCEDNNFRGRCIVISRDARNLGRGGNDRISSIRVR